MRVEQTRGWTQKMIDISQSLQAELHDLYRHLHANPELSMAEHRTADLLNNMMTALGYAVSRHGGTGLAAVLRNGDGPVVAFRADTDALPLAEDTGLAYASTATGTLPDGSTVPVMHACGHDMHIACAVGAATVLSQDLDTWAGTVVFIFQPGEETSAGAAAMVADGLWESVPTPEVVFGQHVWPGVAGSVELTRGPAMAMADSWQVTVHGRGGHGSSPQNSIDPVLLMSHMIVRIQSIVSREVAAQDSAVITVAKVWAGLKENIIPATAHFTVNVRSLDENVRDRVLSALRRVIAAEAEASGAPEPEIEELYRFPLTVNDPETAGQTAQVLVDALGADQVSEVPARMGSEDFGHLPQAIGVPGVYWFFGGLPADVVNGVEPVPSNHSPFFAPIIEPTLSTGVTAALSVIKARLVKA